MISSFKTCFVTARSEWCWKQCPILCLAPWGMMMTHQKRHMLWVKRQINTHIRWVLSSNGLLSSYQIAAILTLFSNNSLHHSRQRSVNLALDHYHSLVKMCGWVVSNMPISVKITSIENYYTYSDYCFRNIMLHQSDDKMRTYWIHN